MSGSALTRVISPERPGPVQQQVAASHVRALAPRPVLVSSDDRTQVGCERLEFGPFRLDLRTRELLREGQPVAITPKSFDVLALLARRADSVVTKDEIIQSVWRGTSVTDDSLSRVIYLLRRALGDDASASKYIATVPRYGYRLAALVRQASSRPSAVDKEGAATTAGNAIATHRRVLGIMCFVAGVLSSCIIGAAFWLLR